MAGCSCRTVELVVEGETVEGIVRVDGDCPRHGLPDVDGKRFEWQWWPPGTGHLRRHAREGEGPRDVEARLLKEASA